MKPKLVIVTGNPLKFRELEIKLRDFFDCEQKTMEEYHEIQGEPENILRQKLTYAYQKFKEPVLVDDTSVHFDALHGFPGPYIRDFFTAFKPFEMGEKFAGSRIEIVCRLGLMKDSQNVIIGEGRITGDVVMPKIENDNGREFDLFVQIDGTDRPMIEFDPKEKNKHSHRGRALEHLLSQIKN